MDDDSDIIMGKSGYWISWYHRRCKTTKRLLESKRKRELEYYYQNRGSLLYKKRMQYRKENPESKEYLPTSKFKPFPKFDEKGFREKGGYVYPVLHRYPKNRGKMMQNYHDGFVV
jgi:hypothetical protein